jgi:two-component system sensor histidine kinase UhpB
MHSALLVGRQTMDITLRRLQNPGNPARDLDDIIASFRGNRHLRVVLVGDAAAAALPVSDQSPFGSVPPWFGRLIGVESVAERVPIAIAGRPYGTVVIETDPHNEILEVWNQLSESLVTLVLFCGFTIVLIYLFTGRALKPLDRLAAALEQVGHGDYRTRVDDHLAPELSRLRDSFNRMAARLAEVASDNRRLNEQLLTLQEQERSDIARDLHDEVSPFLFAINIDAANASRLLAEGRADEVPSHIKSIVGGVRHMQRQVRSMLGRLLPIGLGEFDLADAIGNVVEFWRRRHPEIDYKVSIAGDCEHLDALAETTIYRIVQESLSNAVRHGKPTAIAVAVGRARNHDQSRDEVTIDITDDGQGMQEATRLGYGLLGMNERVRALDGRLTLSNRPSGGFAVAAVLPCSSCRDVDRVAFEEARP